MGHKIYKVLKSSHHVFFQKHLLSKYKSVRIHFASLGKFVTIFDVYFSQSEYCRIIMVYMKKKCLQKVHHDANSTIFCNLKT